MNGCVLGDARFGKGGLEHLLDGLGVEVMAAHRQVCGAMESDLEGNTQNQAHSFPADGYLRSKAFGRYMPADIPPPVSPAISHGF